MGLKFEPLTQSEHDWVQGQMGKAVDLVTFYAPEFATDPLSLQALDAAFANFIARGSVADANNAVLAIGTVFGNHLVKELGFQWVVATDEFGTDLAVMALPGQGNVTVFPTDFVAKRYESKETNFLDHSVEFIRKKLMDVASEHGK